MKEIQSLEKISEDSRVGTIIWMFMIDGYMYTNGRNGDLLKISNTKYSLLYLLCSVDR